MSINIELDRMASILGVTLPGEHIIEIHEPVWDTVYNERLQDGYDEDEATYAANKAISDAEDEAAEAYVNSLVSAFETEAEHFDLVVTKLVTKPGVYAIEPKYNWKSSASLMVTTINGDGLFGYYGSLKEFMHVYCKTTPRQVVAGNLGWIGQAWKIWGRMNPKRKVLS